MLCPHVRRPMRAVLCTSKSASFTLPTAQVHLNLRKSINHSSSILARASSHCSLYVFATVRATCHPKHISQTRGIGTIRSHQSGPEYEDDGLSSDEAEGEDEDEDETELKSSTPDRSSTFAEVPRSSSPDLTPTPSPTVVSLPSPQPARGFKKPSIPKILTRRASPSITSSDTAVGSASQSSSRQSTLTTASTGSKRKVIPSRWQGQKSGAFELDAANDIVGIVMLEIHGATDLPRLRNSELIVPCATISALIGF